MVNILMVSKWHVHAEGYAKYAMSQPDAKVTCIWDEDAARGKAWADQIGVAFEADYAKALARPDVDAIIVDSATSEHKGLIIQAAKAGKHVFTEKTLALKLADAKEIAAAVKEAGVKFVISQPHIGQPHVQLSKQLMDSGALGKIHYMRMRTAHEGSLRGWLPAYWYDVEKAGGGAMMDLGCHPMYTAAYLLGKPTRIASVFNTSYAPPPADDNAVSVAEFEGGAIAVLETSFISPYNAGVYEFLGTEGAVVCEGNKVKYRTKDTKDGWVIPDKLPETLPMPMRIWLDSIQKGGDTPYDMTQALALTELLENAYISHNKQIIQKIP